MTRKGLSQRITWACNPNDKEPTTQKSDRSVGVSHRQRWRCMCTHAHIQSRDNSKSEVRFLK